MDSPVCQTCGTPIVVSERGRRRRYCSDRCRQIASRRRRAPAHQAPVASVVTGQAGEATLVEPDASPDVQVVAAVHETVMLRNTYARLGRDARPELAVRCEEMAEVLEGGLREHFPGAIADE